jgi:DNA-binding PadR family transcriptional regulator
MPKRLEMSDNEYYILNALIHQPLYGYAIRESVKKLTDGRKTLSLATIYDALSRLLQAGLIEKAGDDPVNGRMRRSYRITHAGRQAIQERYRTIEILQGIRQLRVAEGEV